MSTVFKAAISMAVVTATVVAIATLGSALADVLGGIVLVIGVLVFTRSIMAFAAEPGEERQRSDMPR